MILTVLGSGTCELAAEKSSPAYLVRAGGYSLMLDMGQGSLRRLMQAGQEPAGLDAVLFSHHHPDHMADFIPLLFALNFDPVMREKASITCAAHEGFEDFLEGLQAAFGGWLTPEPQNLAMKYLASGQGLNLGPLAIKTQAAKHMPTSLAFRISHGGKGLVYLGDSEATDELAGFAKGADLIIAHCAGPDEASKPGHLYPRAAGELAKRAAAGHLVLSHLYRAVEPRAALASASAAFGGRVSLARDLLSFELA